MRQEQQEYYGIVLPDKDPLEQGRYKVHIPELQQRPDLQVRDGVWCQNGTGSFSGFRNSENQPIISGSYRPIQPGAPVVVSAFGSNNPTIVRLGKTNINLPDANKRDDLYVLEHTPAGSSVEIDDKRGYIALRFKEGLSTVLMTEDSIDLELNTAGGTNKKASVGGISIHPDKITFKLKDITMELNSSGFGVSFKDKPSSYFSMTKNGFELHAEETINLNAKKSITALGNKVVVAGTSDLSLRGSDTRITGSQKMSMNGNQVAIEGFTTVQLKSNLHIGLQSKVKTTIDSMMMDTNILGIQNTYASVSTETTNVKSIASSTYSLATSTLLQDSQIISNMGVGAGVTGSLNPANIATMQATQVGLATAGTIFLMNNPFTSAASLAISATIAGSAEYADSPVGQGSLFGVRDKKDTSSPSSVLNTSLAKRNSDLRKYSLVPEMIKGNARTLAYKYNA